MGGRPTLDPILGAWLADVRLRGERVTFLFQVGAKRRFPRLATAPPRGDHLPSGPLDASDEPDAEDPEQAYYELGLGSVAFVFGSSSGEPIAYLVERNPIGGR